MAAALAALYGVALPAHAGVLPSGGHFVAGSGSIGGNTGSLTINQTTSRGVIDWNGFSIGNGNRVTFNNGNGATLNRVTGGDTSFILGQLSATGSVYLINPQGIVVGANGIVSTGGRFVASTLDVDNTAFMNGGPLTFTGPSTRRVVNLGKVGSTNGDVFLISADEIDNLGSISAPNGTAEIATGRQVLLQDSSTGQQVFVQTGSGGTIENAGPISAAQVSLQAADGNIFALAGDHTTIRATSTATRDGHAWLVAHSGAVTLGGTIAARNADGSVGTVDTDGARLRLGSQGITPLVQAGQWNMTTPQFEIGGLAAASLSRSLNSGTSIALRTTGGSSRTGDIDVASNLNWNGNASLSLGAYRTVSIDNGVTIANKGAGNLMLRADSTAIDNGGSVLNGGKVDWFESTGIVSLLYDSTGRYNPGTLLDNALWVSPTYSGLVTQITGYQLVNSAQDLQNIGNDLAGTYALGKDIDASGFSFVTLGDTSQSQDAGVFSGQLDGMGHTISNFSANFDGIFEDIGTTGVVRNLNVNAYDGVPLAFNPGGILANSSSGTVAQVFVSGSIGSQEESASFGGLVGNNSGLIARSGSSAVVDAGAGAGGLAYGNGGTITESYDTGSVTNETFSFGSSGGLMVVNSGTVTQSFASGLVTSASVYSGGACVFCGTVGNDVYWNAQTTGQSSSGTMPTSNGLTTAQMSNPASFVGWDFAPGGVWAMPAGATHPILAWQNGH